MKKAQRISIEMRQFYSYHLNNGVPKEEIDKQVKNRWGHHFKDCCVCGKQHIGPNKYCSPACEIIYKKKGVKNENC